MYDLALTRGSGEALTLAHTQIPLGLCFAPLCMVAKLRKRVQCISQRIKNYDVVIQ